MKRIISLIFALPIFLSGCSPQPTMPESWEADWTVVSPRLAVEPLKGFVMAEQNDALAVSGIYYATWTAGEAREHINEDGENAVIFDAQIYVLSQEFRDAADARRESASWSERAGTIYQAGETVMLAIGGQEFTLMPLLSSGETNPYVRGIAAWAVRENTAVWVELLCCDNWQGDLRDTLETFLSGFHYN